MTIKHIAKITSFILIAFTMLCSCNRDEEFTVKVYAENYKPFNYLSGNDIVGSSAELIQTVMNTNQEETGITLVPWSEGYNALQEEDNAALITIAMTEEKKQLFKWAGPVATINASFFTNASSGIAIATIEQAKELESIGIPSGYSQQEQLTNQGFTNLIAYETLEEMLTALLNGSVDAVVETKYALENTLEEMGHGTGEISENMYFQTFLGYIAFNKGVPDETVDAWQKSIDQYKENGYFESLYNPYLPGELPPRTFQIFTESNPPQNYLNDENVPEGSAIDIVDEISSRNNYKQPIIMTYWDNALNVLDVNPNTILFSMVRTPERENSFEWAGPICKDITYFYMNPNNPQTINSLDDARVLNTVGVVQGWLYEAMLEDEGFENLVTFTTPSELHLAIINQQIEAAVLPDISINYLSEINGTGSTDLIPTYELIQNEVYIAFSLDSNPTLVETWQNTLEDIKSDGTFNIIWNKWYPGIVPPR